MLSRAELHVSPCWSMTTVIQGGSENLWLSVVCDVLLVCVFVARVWWLQWVWIKDSQWGESVLYLLPYLFLCAQRLKPCIALYWGQEAVNKVGLKCNVFSPSSNPPASVAASTTNKSSGVNVFPSLRGKSQTWKGYMFTLLFLTLKSPDELPDSLDVGCKQEVSMLWPVPVYLQTPQCSFCLPRHTLLSISH